MAAGIACKGKMPYTASMTDENNSHLPFYQEGLRFRCTQCGGESRCCRGRPGVVQLGPSDLTGLARAEGLTENQFIQAFCRWIPEGNGWEFLSLRELSNYDCVLWGKSGCRLYEARPVQCRTYPFWPFVVEDKKSWESEADDCPGIGQGPLHPRDEIEKNMREYGREERIRRRCRDPYGFG